MAKRREKRQRRRPYLIPLVSGSELETRLKFSRSQNRTRRSAAPDARRNSCGWNSTSVTGAVCSRSSDNNRPARKSQICKQRNSATIQIPAATRQFLSTLSIKMQILITCHQFRPGNTSISDMWSWDGKIRTATLPDGGMRKENVRTLTAPSSPADATHWPSGLNRRLLTVKLCPL